MPIIDLDFGDEPPKVKEEPVSKDWAKIKQDRETEQFWKEYLKPGGAHDQWKASGMPF